ncbi:MAG: hypothetical protein ACHQ6U_12915 [Thermodesulfobacteriota bacterium]
MKRFKIGYKRSIDMALFDFFIEQCRKEGKLRFSDDSHFRFVEREAETAFKDFANGDKRGLLGYLIRLEKTQFDRYLKSLLN